jgi:hypothetical protein
MAVP